MLPAYYPLTSPGTYGAICIRLLLRYHNPVWIDLIIMQVQNEHAQSLLDVSQFTGPSNALIQFTPSREAFMLSAQGRKGSSAVSVLTCRLVKYSFHSF